MEAILALPAHFKTGAFLEHVMHPPHGPHALGEVRVEVAMVDGIARHPVAVARTAVGDFVGVADPRANALGIDVVGIVVIGVEQPLVAMQVEDVLFMAVVGVAELGEVTDVAVVHVGRFRREQGHAGLDPDGAGRWYLARTDVLQADVGRHVHQRTDITDRVRTEEELLIGARQAVMHRPHAQAVGHHFGAHATGTVVDHERVAGGFQYVAHHRVGPVTRKRLGAGDLVGELRGEVTERLQAVGQRRVALAQAFQRVGGLGETAIGVGAHDDGIGFAVDDLVAVDHGNDRLAGLAFGDPGLHLRVAGFVVDHRLAGGGTAGGGQAHFFFGEGIAVGAAEFWHHHYLAEQAVGNVARSALAAECGGLAGSGKSAFAFGVQGIAAGAAWADEEVAIAPGVGRNIGDAVDRLHAVDLEADHALGHLLVSDEAFGGVIFELRPLFFALRLFSLDAVLVGVGLVVEQVGQVDGKAFTGGHPQHDGPRALVRAQGDLARYRRPAAAEGDHLVVHHILAQGEHHAVGVLRAKAVEHQWLVQRHHVGDQGALALHGGFAGRLPAEQGQYE